MKAELLAGAALCLFAFAWALDIRTDYPPSHPQSPKTFVPKTIRGDGIQCTSVEGGGWHCRTRQWVWVLPRD